MSDELPYDLEEFTIAQTMESGVVLEENWLNFYQAVIAAVPELLTLKSSSQTFTEVTVTYETGVAGYAVEYQIIILDDGTYRMYSISGGITRQRGGHFRISNTSPVGQKTRVGDIQNMITRLEDVFREDLRVLQLEDASTSWNKLAMEDATEVSRWVGVTGVVGDFARDV